MTSSGQYAGAVPFALWAKSVREDRENPNGRASQRALPDSEETRPQPAGALGGPRPVERKRVARWREGHSRTRAGARAGQLDHGRRAGAGGPRRPEPEKERRRPPASLFWLRWREQWRHGWTAFGYHLLRRLLDRGKLARMVDLRVHQVIAVAPWHLQLPPRLARGLSVRELTKRDLDVLERLRAPSGVDYGERFDGSHRAFGAFLQERLVAFVWVRRGPVLLPSSFGGLWQLGRGMAWIYDLYSDPCVLGAIPHLYAYLRQHPPGAFCRQLAGQNEYDNLRSRLAHRRLGYQICAVVCSLRLGPIRVRASRRVVAGGRGRWQWHRRQAILPVHVWAEPVSGALHTDSQAGDVAVAAVESPEAGGAGEAAVESVRVRLQCRCGRSVAARGTDLHFICSCGAEVGHRQGGMVTAGAPTPYWGEISQSEMQAVLRRADERGWRQAVTDLVPPRLHDYIASSERIGFADLLAIPADARILDVGAGWGGIATQLARGHDVVALEGVRERAQFIALVAQQERLARLTVVNGDLNRSLLADGQFDLIVVNGVLEWVGLFDTSAAPEAVQLVFLHRLRELLRPGGRIYLAIENRFGWAELCGALDHSGLPYTSLLPRPLARWVCARSPQYRSQFNQGYRTYTYSHRGYLRLFEQIGLSARRTWIATEGYNSPAQLVPLDDAAIRFAHTRALPPTGWRGRLVRQLHHAGGRRRIWRWLGSDFCFLLDASEAAGPRSRPAEPNPSAWGFRA